MPGRSLSLGVKLMTSFLVVDLILVAVGVFGLVTQDGIHDRVSAVTTRDIEPLSHLRVAQNGNHTITIIGFAALTASTAQTKQELGAAVPAVQKGMEDAFGRLKETTPAELKPQVDDLVATYEQMAEADRTYRANLDAPDAAELAARVSGLYEQTEAKFDQVAAAFIADAADQEKQTDAAYERSRTITWILLVLGVTAGLVLATLITRSLRRRTHTIIEALNRLSAGDLTTSVEVRGSDEIAQMAGALNSSIAAMRTAIADVNGSATALADSAGGLSAATEETATAVRVAGEAVDSVVASADNVTRTVDDVASSTTELAASIRDISENAQQAAGIAGNAVGVVDATNATISKLGNSSQQIGNVVQVIQSIAAQTSLLALNATIEAARAGEAGRGFAVVAGEVKELARETAEATESVITQVEAIQADTEGAVRAIAQIGEIIQQINGYQATIAAAVEEQSATTESISGSLSQALQITRRIAGDIERVSAAAQGGNTAVGSTLALAASVADMGEQLRTVVASFRL